MSSHHALVIEEIVELLHPDQRLFFVTGAGISADSGLPTYRGAGGIYEVDQTEDEMPIEQALSGSVFRSRPDITWKYLAQVGHAARRPPPRGPRVHHMRGAPRARRATRRPDRRRREDPHCRAGARAKSSREWRPIR